MTSSTAVGDDDDADCEHSWVLVGVILKAGESVMEHRCARCDGLLVEPATRPRA